MKLKSEITHFEGVVFGGIGEKRGEGLSGARLVPVRHANHRPLVPQGTLKLHGQEAVPLRKDGHAVSATRVTVRGVFWTQARGTVVAGDGLETVRAVVVLQFVESVRRLLTCSRLGKDTS